jgi:hypothetical protein
LVVLAVCWQCNLHSQIRFVNVWHDFVSGTDDKGYVSNTRVRVIAPRRWDHISEPSRLRGAEAGIPLGVIRFKCRQRGK